MHPNTFHVLLVQRRGRGEGAEAAENDPCPAEDVDWLGRETREELDRQQVQKDLDRPPEAVLALAIPARVMPHGYLAHTGANLVRKRRYEAVHLSVEPQVLDDLGAIRLQRAAAVVEADARDAADQPVGDT